MVREGKGLEAGLGVSGFHIVVNGRGRTERRCICIPGRHTAGIERRRGIEKGRQSTMLITFYKRSSLPDSTGTKKQGAF